VSAGDPRLIAPRPVTIRDRRELPFFQVRLKAVQAIRTELNGPRRLRTIGFYGLLCQLANEQRHTGEHRRLQFTYDLLANRGGIARRNVKVMLDYLQHAGVARYERLTDAERGATVSILHLLVHNGSWTPISVAMADRLATPRPGGHPLRELGLLIILLEFCAAQRESQDGVTAEVTRGEIADQAGLTVDRVDQCNHHLQDAGVLTITRRRSSNGGRHLASLYTIHEAPAAMEQGLNWNRQCRVTKLPGPWMRTGRAANGNSQSRRWELAGPQKGTHRTEMSGRLLPGASADWQIILADGTALGDIRYLLQTDRGDLLYVRSRSIRHGSPEVLARLGRGEDVDPGEYTFRTSTRIETAAPDLDWLNKGIFISVAGRQAAGVIYETYLVG